MNKRLIKLCSIDDVKEFVNNVKELNDTVLVSKEGYGVQLDGESLLGLMSLIGSRIIVSYNNTSERFNQILDRRQVV